MCELELEDQETMSPMALTFWSVLVITILVYVLRGIGILTFIPGGVILFLMLLTLFTFIGFLIQKTRRF